MKRRNADCGKIRRPIKKNKIAEQIGSNTLLYFKFLLLWVSVITADFLLEFRFEFLWPFWLLLRSVHDSFKYKGLAFSVLFICIAITSDLVCLFFIPVQWLFFAASTYVWVQYVWHTDKGICLPTIILWILFVYLEAAIRWKDSRNIPHLDLCRPFAAHCIGYPVVTLGFGFKSYVGYRIRQRKQREVAKDNDFYMQLLQEALPKEESILLEPPVDGSCSPNDQLATKDVVPVAGLATVVSVNSLNNSSSNTTSGRSDTVQNHHHHPNHHNHNHHHHNNQQQHQQQQQQQHQSHSKSAQSHKSPSNSNGSSLSTPHVNGHVISGSSPSAGSAMNGGLNHQHGVQSGSFKQRKSVEKDSSNASATASASFPNGGSKMNGGGGSGGNYSYHQAPTSQQSSASGATPNIATTSTVSSITTNSTKDHTTSHTRGTDHGAAGSGSHLNGGSVAREKEPKDGLGTTQHRKECDKDASGSHSSAASNSSTSSSCTRSVPASTIRSKSPTDTLPTASGGAIQGNNKLAGEKPNGHVLNHEQHQTSGTTDSGSPATIETKVVGGAGGGGGGGRSGRKNRTKKAAEQANLSAIAKLCASLALASSVTTLTSTTVTSARATTSGASDTVTLTTSSSAGPISSSSTKDNHQHSSGDQVNSSGKGNMSSSGSASSSIGTHANVTSNNTQHGLSAGGGTAEGKCYGSSANGTTTTVPGGSSSSQPPLATTTVVIHKACESCPRFEGDLKKLRTELAAHRQAENELRQKYESSAANLKASLQVKQKDYDELHTRYQDLSTQRQQERQSLQTVERRLGEERRHRQSLETQLNNERKHRKQAEEKASRAECGEACKVKKQQMELDIDKLQHDLVSLEDAKHMAEKQARSYEQEMRNMEAQMRNREAQQNTDVLMSALAAMQDKNTTLEKNLSAETRVKLDLFSALGATRREMEILTCSLRTKEKEVLDLKAKIVQLVAVMPNLTNDALCLAGHGSSTGSDGVPGASMMRLPDAPQLLPQSMSGGPLNGVGGGGVTGQSGQQPSPMSHRVLNGQPMMSQLGSLGVLTSSMTTLPSVSSVLSGQNPSHNSCGPPPGSVGVSLASLAVGAGGGSSTGGGCGGGVGHIVQMQNSNNAPNGNCPSNLDPNATVYTPKNNGMVGGTEA